MLVGEGVFGATTGLLAGAFLATTMGFSVYSYSTIAEPLLALWMTAALLCFWGHRREPDRRLAGPGRADQRPQRAGRPVRDHRPFPPAARPLPPPATLAVRTRLAA